MKKSVNIGTVSGVVSPRWKKVLIAIIAVGAVCALAVGVYFLFWHKDTNAPTLNDNQQRTEDTISAQDQFMQTDPNAPPDQQAINYANLAQSYAFVKQCTKAKEALIKAKEVAPADMKQTIQLTDNYVKGYCP